jgi:chromosome segregation ATPase
LVYARATYAYTCATPVDAPRGAAATLISRVDGRRWENGQTDYAHVLAELKAWIEGEDMMGGEAEGSVEAPDETDAELRGLEAAAAAAAAATEAARAYPAAAALEQLQAAQADADTLAARLDEAHAAAAEARAAAAAATAQARSLKGQLDHAHAALQRREARKVELAQLRSQLNEAAPALQQVCELCESVRV